MATDKITTTTNTVTVDQIKKELKALDALVKPLAELPPEAQRRIIRYAVRLFNVDTSVEN